MSFPQNEQTIELKTKAELDLMRTAARAVAEILKKLEKAVRLILENNN